MAEEEKRIIDQITDSALSSGDFVMVDSSSEGTRKFDLGAGLSAINASIAAEATARSLADETINEAIAGLTSDLTEEALARESAELELQTSISAEAAAREAAINTEATARTNADTTLQGNITAEATARANAVTAEATARTNAINAEATARAAADTAINGEITQLNLALTTEETARANAVSAEATAREAADDAINTALETKANVNGYYQEMTAGDAEQLVSTVFVEDSVPYQFRTSGGSADIGDREYDEIVGGSIVWNQRITFAAGAEERNGIRFEKKSDGTIIVTGTATANATISIRETSMFKNHVYLLKGCPQGGSNTSYALYANQTNPQLFDTGNGSIKKQSSDTQGLIYIIVYSGQTVNLTFVPQLFDLTAMFGSTIADYIHSLGVATAGAGAAWFKKLFPKDYYAYNAGTMMHVSDLQSHDMVGFNALPTTPEYISNAQILDKTKAVRVVAGQQYQFTFDGIGSATNWRIFAKFWDLSENMQIGGTRPFSVSTGEPTWNASYYGWLDGVDSVNHDRTYTFNRDGYLTLQFWGGSTTSSMEMKNPCFHLVWDGERDGEYEPYVKHSYPLDDSLTLRGILKLDENDQLYYDGDIYSADGTVTRRYGIVDLGTLTWGNAGATGFAFASLSSVGSGNNNKLNNNFICDKYGVAYWNSTDDKTVRFSGLGNQVGIKDTAFANYTAADFKVAMSGVYLVYELATPTTEEAEPYNEVQIVDDFGTEEYVTTSLVPVGHNTKYANNLRAKLEMAPESPNDNGDYIVRHANGQNTYVLLTIPTEIPTAPSEDGTYALKCTVASGTPTYTWEAET